jgi:AcrR family transcriptional regulator
MSRNSRRPYHHGDLRRAFLAEAAKLVEAEGIQALRLREVARRVGVSHAASTNHFPDKSALLAELAADGFDELANELEREAKSLRKHPAARLRGAGRAYIRFALRRPGHYRVMFGHTLAQETPARLATSGGRAYGLLEQVVAAALPKSRARNPERVREAAFLAWSAVHGAATLILDGSIPPTILSSSEDLTALVDYVTAAATRAVVG